MTFTIYDAVANGAAQAGPITNAPTVVSNDTSNSGALRTFTFTNNPADTNQFFLLAYPR